MYYRPSSAYILSLSVPLIAPVIAKLSFLTIQSDVLSANILHIYTIPSCILFM